MDIVIKRADTSDALVLSELSTVTFLDTFSGTCTDDDIHQFVTKSFNKEIILNELKDPLDYYFIAFIDNHPAGYLRVKEEVSDVPLINKYNAIELKRIYVAREYLSKKVGAALMQFALKFAADNKYEAVWLGVWEHNERAIAFYKKWGFADTGYTHDFPIGSTPQKDHWFMKIIEDAR